MSKTKTRILNTSLQVFNEIGYPQASLDKLAATLEMSKGNLAYHFANPGKILEALYQEMYQMMEGKVWPGGLPELQHYQAIISHTYQFQYRYRFFFLDTSEIMRRHPEIAALHAQTIAKRWQEATALIRYFVGAGWVISEPYTGAYQDIAQSVWSLNTFWFQRQMILNKPIEPTVPRELLDQAWGLIFPWLTEQGKKIAHPYFLPKSQKS
ncbi:MAG: TetR/AcrR family transcriptional regulator [Bacteroidota bacterium]